VPRLQCERRLEWSREWSNGGMVALSRWMPRPVPPPVPLRHFAAAQIGDPVKFALGFTSMVFDVVFMVQVSGARGCNRTRPAM